MIAFAPRFAASRAADGPVWMRTWEKSWPKRLFILASTFSGSAWPASSVWLTGAASFTGEFGSAAGGVLVVVGVSSGRAKIGWDSRCWTSVSLPGLRPAPTLLTVFSEGDVPLKLP